MEEEDRFTKNLRNLFTLKSLRDFFIFLLLVSLAIVAADEAQKRVTERIYSQMCSQYVETVKACNGTSVISCIPPGTPFNYSAPFYPNSSSTSP